MYWLVASCTSKGLSWDCLLVCLSRPSGAKDCTKASFSWRDSVELCPGLLETHIAYFKWAQHTLPSHSISDWICYRLSSFFLTSKYVQELPQSGCSYQLSLKNDGKQRILNNPVSSKIVQGHTIKLAVLNIMNASGAYGFFCCLQGE